MTYRKMKSISLLDIVIVTGGRLSRELMWFSIVALKYEEYLEQFHRIFSFSFLFGITSLSRLFYSF